MKRKSKLKKVWNVFSTIILIVLVLFVIFAFITRLSGEAPSVFGFTLYRVQSESMSPTLKVGDVILDKKTPAEDIKKNDIVTFECLTGDYAGHTITHRVVEEPECRSGYYYFQTKGDKDGSPLDDIISYDQIKGKYLCTIPGMNKLYSFLLSSYGIIVLIVLIILLFGYEMIALMGSYKTLDSKDDMILEYLAKKAEEKKNEENGEKSEIADHPEKQEDTEDMTHPEKEKKTEDEDHPDQPEKQEDTEDEDHPDNEKS